MLVEQVSAVIQDPGVKEPGHGIDPSLVRDGLHRAGKEASESFWSQIRRQIIQPAGATKLRRSNDIQSEHIEVRGASFQVGHIEQMLLIRGRGQYLILYLDVGMGALKSVEQRTQGLFAAQEPGVLED